MASRPDYRQFLITTVGTIPPSRKTRPRFRETLDTIILGSLSSSVGIVVLIVVVSGMAGRPMQDWHNINGIDKSKFSARLEPSNTCAVAVVVGEMLGLTGIGLARARGPSISPLCTLGTILCLSHILLFFINFILI